MKTIELTSGKTNVPFLASAPLSLAVKATLVDSDPLFMANKASDTQGEASSENQILASPESHSPPCSPALPLLPLPPLCMCVSLCHRVNTLKHVGHCFQIFNSFVCVYVYARMVDDHGGQKRPLDTVELNMQVVVSQTIWMLGIKLWSSTRAVCAF